MQTTRVTFDGRLRGRESDLSLLAAIFSIVLLPAIAFAGRGNDLVHAQLLIDTTHPQPNQPFHLGVLFTIEPGWHIYWRNAGDSGLPTKLTPHLPAGYAAGPVQFPLPTKLSLPGDIVNYAYEKQVMLILPVTAPATVDPSAEIEVDASWLVCQDVCLPGKSTLSIKLSDAAAVRPDLFARWQSQIPVDRDPHVLGVNLNADESAATAKVSWNGAAPADIQFFPGSTDIDTASISCETKGATTTIHYKAAGSAAKRGTLSTDGMLEFTVAGGKRLGLSLKFSP